MEVCTSSEVTSSAILPNFKVVLRDLRFTRANFWSYCISEQHLKGDSVFVLRKKANASSSWTADEVVQQGELKNSSTSKLLSDLRFASRITGDRNVVLVLLFLLFLSLGRLI